MLKIIIRYFFTGLITLTILYPAFAQEKKIYIFPVITLNTDSELGHNYTNTLKEKLSCTEIFDIIEIKNLAFQPETTRNLSISLKKAVDEKCVEMDIKTAVYGYISKKESWYDIKVFLYSFESSNIISSYSDKIYSESEIEYSAKNAAVEFAVKESSIKSSKIFFSSALCPGLGHLLMKKYTKGVLFSSIFGYLMYNYVKLGKPEHIDNPFSTLSAGLYSPSTPTGALLYFYNGEQITYEEYQVLHGRWEQENEPVRQNNEKIKSDRKKIQTGIAAIYLISLIDTIFSSKSLDTRRKIEEKFSFDLYPWGRKPMINFNYRF